jgi:hypothetical protein
MSLKTAGIRPSVKNDPRLVAAARELKDRWLEEINSGRYLPMANGKYDLARTLIAAEVSGQLQPTTDHARELPLLTAA